MLFNSIEFLIFFPIVVIAYFVFPKCIRNYWLLICSYYFYMCWNPKYILLLIATTIVTYLSGLFLDVVKRKKTESIQFLKKIIVAASFIINIGLLVYFKYIDFAINVWTDMAAKFGITVISPTFDIILPVGISFYIFQALSYTMDVYRDEIYAEKNIFRYALFVSFFPQLVAGPIERSKNLLKQLAKPGEFVYENVRNGLLTMLWGFFLKLVIADRCAVIVDNIFEDVSSYRGYELVVASVLFALQIYCDFMSYSTIAKGAAEVIGYSLMDNFDLPYFAVSIKDFWRRWHISLSSWLRDYLYIPLGGNRKGLIRKYVNILITFFVSGLWHGAAYTFVLWGLLHGLYQIIEDIMGRLVKKASLLKHINMQNPIMMIIRIPVTFVLVDVAWVLFRANTLADAMVVFNNMWYDNWDNFKDGIFELGLNEVNIYMLLGSLVILFISSLMRRFGIKLRDWISSRLFVVRYACYWTAMIMIMFSLDIEGKEFIYFQF